MGRYQVKLKGDLEQTMTHVYDGMKDFYWAMGLHLFPGVGMRGSVLSPARSPYWTQPGIGLISMQVQRVGSCPLSEGRRATEGRDIIKGGYEMQGCLAEKEPPPPRTLQ